MKVLLFIFSIVGYSQTTYEAAQIAFNKKYDQNQALVAKKLYLEIYAKSTDSIDKCFCLNRISYLDFLSGTRKTIELPVNATNIQIEQAQKQELKLLKDSINRANLCKNLYGTSMNVNDYTKLSDKEISLFTQAHYLYSTSLARASEIEGFRVVLKNWPHIKKSMKFIINLKKESTFFYGPFRTLGIANTKMPNPFGNKEEALKYLSQAVNKSKWNNKTISKYIYNSIALADYYKKMNQTTKACTILSEIIKLSSLEIERENSDLIAETLIDQKRAKKNFESFSCN